MVCGRVIDLSAASVANVELQLVSEDQVVATVFTDPKGHFMFGAIPKGDYNLTTKPNAGMFLRGLESRSRK